jgi:hypothetical protein
VRTRFGDILGEDRYIEEAKKRFDRRQKHGQSRRMRIEDHIFETPQDIIREFQKNHGTRIEDINANSLEGKRQRAKLLVLLKDRAGLSYREVIKFPIFMSLKYSSLGQIYRRAKKKTGGKS